MKPIILRKARRALSATRDDNGVPRIEAANWLDALYGLGYVQALDRGTQLLFSRTIASGRAARDIADSPELRDTDRFFRRVRLDRHIEREVKLLDDRTRAQLRAFSDGVNDGLADGGRTWPMWATGYRTEPWDEAAILLVGQLLAFGGLAISQMQNERLVVELAQAGAPDEGLRELLGPRLDGVDFDLLRQIKISSRISDEALELIADLPRLAGSNAWAVSPARSATGHALLASDPHLEVNRLPSIWYEAVLTWDDQYVMGATLAGAPLFAVARTNRLAWGVTYMKGDTVDFFIEDCRKNDGVWQYRRGDDWRDFTVREEPIGRPTASDTPPVVQTYYENDTGVLESDPEKLGPGLHLSLAWVGFSEGSGRSIATWLDVAASPDVKTALDVARDCPVPTLCWVAADVDGHIGLQGCGWHPKRGNGQLGLAPIPAWDERNHWQGWLSPDLLPRSYDPPEGFVATANEELNPPGGPMLITQPLPDYRKRRIVERLGELPAATLKDMQDLQYDMISNQARDLLAVFLPYMEDGPIKERLATWDGNYDPTSREAPLFQRLYRNVLVELFGHEEGLGWRRMLYLCSRAGYSLMVLTAADRLMAREHSHWWRDRDKGELIRRAAASLVREPNLAWSDVNTFHFADRFFGGRRVGRVLGFDSRRYPMPGCHATVFQGHVLQTATRETTFAPSYHFVTDLGTDQAWTNLPGGASENRFSRYYNTDIARWFSGEYKRIAPQA